MTQAGKAHPFRQLLWKPRATERQGTLIYVVTLETWRMRVYVYYTFVVVSVDIVETRIMCVCVCVCVYVCTLYCDISALDPLRSYRRNLKNVCVCVCIYIVL